MRFLLVAPYNGAHSDTVERARSQGDELLEARDSSTPRLLAQTWIDLPEPLEALPDGIGFDNAARCQIGNRLYYALEVTVEGEDEDVVALETRLSGAARDYFCAQADIQRDELPWVARYALLTDESEPTHWMSARRHVVDLTEAAAVESSVRVSIEAGWGNGIIRNWPALSRPAQYQLTRGIIDAQHIWHDASIVVSENEDVFGRVIDAQRRPSRREVRELVRESARIDIAASAHQLLLDDLIQNIQGVRRESAEAFLDAWGYERFVGRLLERVRDAATQVATLRARIDSRYQSAVQATLLVLGFLVVVDTVLSFISTAYSGAVDDIPGGAEGFFALLRDGDADILLGTGLAVTLVLTAMFIRRR